MSTEGNYDISLIFNEFAIVKSNSMQQNQSIDKISADLSNLKGLMLTFENELNTNIKPDLQILSKQFGNSKEHLENNAHDSYSPHKVPFAAPPPRSKSNPQSLPSNSSPL